ncbi:hypothetical protein ABW19_dt0205018 [Dactylella cylindrospora]|nr:hypothetical protein ABW19_dt0205018 [Dactylella cylindrospora]
MGRPRKRRRSDALRAHQAVAGGNGEVHYAGGMSGTDQEGLNGNNTSQWLDGNMFLGDESRLLDLNILGPGDGHHHHVGGCIPPHVHSSAPSSNFDPGLAESTDTPGTDFDTLFNPSVQAIDFSSLLSDLVPAQETNQPPNPQPETVPHHHCSASPPNPPSDVIDHSKFRFDNIGTAITPKSLTAFGITSTSTMGLNCDCLLHFFSAIMTLKRMIYNPVHLSPPTPFATPPPPISLEEITAISSTAIQITKTSLKCPSCNMCFTTLMNVGQLLGLLLRAYSQFLQTSSSMIPRAQAKRVVDEEMDKILDILGQVEIRSLARHGMVLDEETRVTKDMVGRGLIERLATGNWVGDRNPLCLKIVNMVRGLSDGLLCGVGVGECVNGQCNSALNNIA